MRRVKARPPARIQSLTDNFDVDTRRVRCRGCGVHAEWVGDAVDTPIEDRRGGEGARTYLSHVTVKSAVRELRPALPVGFEHRFETASGE